MKLRLDEILENKIKAKRVEQEADEKYRLSLPCHITPNYKQQTCVMPCTFEVTLEYLDYGSCLKLLGVSKSVRTVVLTSHVGWLFAQK